MAKLKKKTEKVETVETSVEENKYMNEEESEVLKADGEAYVESTEQVSSERMHKVLDLLQEEFDIKSKGFELVGYNDKTNKIEAVLSNMDYEVKFTLKTNALMRLK